VRQTDSLGAQWCAKQTAGTRYSAGNRRAGGGRAAWFAEAFFRRSPRHSMAVPALERAGTATKRCGNSAEPENQSRRSSNLRGAKPPAQRQADGAENDDPNPR
jgi:hypothetical protein